jgi:glutathione synthase/RimK-type ligase-like ATP-grasp enzyme
LGLKLRRLYTDEQGTLVAKPSNRIINWGCSSVNPRLAGGTFINSVAAVGIAANKLTTFAKLKEAGTIIIPEYTISRDEAEQWINEGKVVVCRTKLTGHSGAGIKLAARPEDLPEQCPLFVKYIKKAKEFRVHVAFGQVIDVQEKRKRQDYDGETDYAIRNHHTGWVYCRENLEEPEGLREQAIQSVLTLGLDFGAVDIIYNKHQNQCYVLEVNTAPGLEGTSVEKYTNAFKGYFANATQR